MKNLLRYIDLFCGIGGFHFAANNVSRSRGLALKCVMACDIDTSCQQVYEENFGQKPIGDITQITTKSVPDHDLLFAGFPCQPFSIIGEMRGFKDTRGTLFFEVARILEEKKPKAFVLENVKMLVGHQQGKTLGRIMETLRDLGYFATFRVLNSLDFGLPQKRERVFIVGFKTPTSFLWPEGGVPMIPLRNILEKRVSKYYNASDRIVMERLKHQSPEREPTIWHENKAGNVSKYPFSCALRAGASHNYLLVNGKRRLTEREMLRLQGFPEEFKIICNYSTTRRHIGNAVPVPVVSAVMERVIDSLGCQTDYKSAVKTGQYSIVMERK